VVLRLFQFIQSAAKIAAVPIVLIWNYLGRRLFVFGNDVPAQPSHELGRE
jgi:hypothetical protein